MSTISKLPIERWGEFKKIILEMYQTEPSAWSLTYEDQLLYADDYWKRQVENFWYEFYETTLFALEDDKVVGLIGIMFDRRKKVKHVATIVNFYVTKEFRGKGIGKQLFEKALEKAKSNPQIKKIKLSVTSKQTDAYNLYKSFGFEEVGRWKKEIEDNGEYLDSIWMELFV